MLLATLCPKCQQACYTILSRFSYCVNIYGFGHVYCALALPFEGTTPFVVGGVANALSNSGFARSCLWNLAIFILYSSDIHLIKLNYLHYWYAILSECINLEPPLLTRPKYSMIDNNGWLCGPPAVCLSNSFNSKIVCHCYPLFCQLGKSIFGYIMPLRKRAGNAATAVNAGNPVPRPN